MAKVSSSFYPTRPKHNVQTTTFTQKIRSKCRITKCPFTSNPPNSTTKLNVPFCEPYFCSQLEEMSDAACRKRVGHLLHMLDTSATAFRTLRDAWAQVASETERHCLGSQACCVHRTGPPPRLNTRPRLLTRAWSSCCTHLPGC